MQLSPKMMSSIGADVGTALMLLGNPSVSIPRAEPSADSPRETLRGYGEELKARGIPVDEMVAEERAKVVKLRLPRK
jgi:hypothetical protein